MTHPIEVLNNLCTKLNQDLAINQRHYSECMRQADAYKQSMDILQLKLTEIEAALKLLKATEFIADETKEFA